MKILAKYIANFREDRQTTNENAKMCILYLIRTDALDLHHRCAVLVLFLATTHSKGILSRHATTVVAAVERQGGAVGGLADALGDT